MNVLRNLVKRIVPRGTRSFEYLRRVYQSMFASREREARRIFLTRMTEAADPFVVQIGANDGDDELSDDIMQYGFSGILVEPQRDAFAALTARYASHPRVLLENVAIAESNATRTLYSSRHEFIGDFPASGLATLVPDKNGLASEGTDRLLAEPVQCMTFDELMERHDVERIDYLQIDTEGYDCQILRSIDLHRYLPDMLRYEYINLHADEQADCLRILHGHGYKTLILSIDVFGYQSRETD